MKPIPVWLSAALLAVATLFLYSRGGADRVPPSRPLDQMPMTLGSWQGRNQPIAQEALEVLGNGVFLNRLYQPVEPPGKADEPTLPVSLFIGYFPTQRTGSTIHSPQNCLPGAGWTFDSKGTTKIKFGVDKEIEIGDYLVSNGSSKLEVFYWYQTQGKAIASDYKARYQLMADSIRYRRSDAALVRMMTPLRSDADRDVARARLKSFAASVLPLLPAYVPN